MRQVPDYTVIGSGRMATHFCHYFDLLQISYVQWSRQFDPQKEQLDRIIADSKRILLLISDDAIEPFIVENPGLHTKQLIHCSGRLSTALADGAHPLLNFGQDVYDLATYQNVPFILETGRATFAELFPQLTNPHFSIAAELKPFYHAMCVMAGNFACILWQEIFQRVENNLQMPKEIFYPYLQQVLSQTFANPATALTGPLKRGDAKTLHANLKALETDPLQKIYQTFVDFYQATRGAS